MYAACFCLGLCPAGCNNFEFANSIESWTIWALRMNTFTNRISNFIFIFYCPQVSLRMGVDRITRKEWACFALTNFVIGLKSWELIVSNSLSVAISRKVIDQE